jgi:regulator of protease activity HflC (stomatin/prohibitin superfamily)
MLNHISGLVFMLRLLEGGLVSILTVQIHLALALLAGIAWTVGGLILASSIRLAAPWQKGVVFRLGKFVGPQGAGPLLDHPRDRPGAHGQHAGAPRQRDRPGSASRASMRFAGDWTSRLALASMRCVVEWRITPAPRSLDDLRSLPTRPARLTHWRVRNVVDRERFPVCDQVRSL